MPAAAASKFRGRPDFSCSAALLLLLLAACGAGKKVVKPYDLGIPAAQQADDYVAAESPKAVRGSRRVVIPYFQVEFVQQSAAEAAGGNYKTGGPISTTSSKTVVTLTGVDARQFQAIADDFYDAVLADLKVAGMEVVPFEQLRTAPEYQTLAGHGFKASPDRVENRDNISLFYAPHGMQIYYLPADPRLTGQAVGKKGNTLGSGLSAFMGVMKSTYGGAAYNYADEEKALAKALDAKALRVRVVVDFADVSASADGYHDATASTKVRLSFAADDSFYAFVSGDGEARFSLKQPLVSGDSFAEKKRDTFSTGPWEAAADGKAYEATVRKHLEVFRQMMMAKVVASR